MIETQTQKFNDNWLKNYALYGTQKWLQEPDFCYYIQAEIPKEVGISLNKNAQDFFKKIGLTDAKILDSSEYYITITLPGRLGTHFQKNDISFMTQTLKNISKDTPQINLSLGNFNVFSSTIFSEIYDPSNRLKQLHETLCNEIPFSQHPEFRYQNYLPHISLAYGGSNNIPITQEIDRENQAIEFQLKDLTLGKVKWQNETMYKETVAKFQLQ